MPVGRRLRPGERLRLVVEIVTSYRSARKALRQTEIEAAVRTLRGDADEAVLDGARSDAGNSSRSNAGSSRSNAGSSRSGVRSGAENELLTEARRLGRAVRLTLRLVPGDTRCLTRSLVLIQLLARRGIPARLVIGTRVDPGFSAHAWVEHAGQPVLPAGEHSLGRLVEL